MSLSTGAKTYLVADALGSVRGAVNASGSLTGTTAYDAWGNPRPLAGSPPPHGFAAGKAFLRYRRGGGDKRSPMPDFYIGAHAAIAGYRLLTRDVPRYRTYFPAIDIVGPSGGFLVDLFTPGPRDSTEAGGFAAGRLSA